MSAHLERVEQLRERYEGLIRGKQEARRFNDELTPELYEAFYHLWRNAHSIPRELSEQNLLLENGEYRLQIMLALMQELLAGGRVLSTREPRSPRAEDGLWLFFEWLEDTVDQLQAYDQAFNGVWQEIRSKPVGIPSTREVSDE